MSREFIETSRSGTASSCSSKKFISAISFKYIAPTYEAYWMKLLHIFIYTSVIVYNFQIWRRKIVAWSDSYIHILYAKGCNFWHNHIISMFSVAFSALLIPFHSCHFSSISELYSYAGRRSHGQGDRIMARKYPYDYLDCPAA